MEVRLGRPEIYTRREFLAGAAAAAIAAGCSASEDGSPQRTTTSPPADPSSQTTGARPTTSTTPAPTTSSPSTSEATSTTVDPLAAIVAVAVHPGVGIARVGNSVDSFYFGPELPEQLPIAPDGFKDATGAIARQAARFRVYGYDADGDVIAEITAADADITWTVNVANTKAAWYDFDRAMDLPIAEPVGRRNPDVTGPDRRRLVVDPGERSISGPAAAPVALDGGRFLDEPVSLGELLTDELGRLVFLPGEGRGYAPGQVPLTSFANNDGWCDDTSDGPVRATVTIGATSLQAEPGWIVVGPPNYGPGLRAGLVTGYDVARLGWDDVGGLTAADVSFRDDILPILGRIVDMQWVNAGYLASNGWKSGADYLAPDLLDRLADPSPASADLRRQVFDRFRPPDPAIAQPTAEPHIYGDGVAFPAQSSYQWLAVTPIQYAALGAWAAGSFTDDRAEPRPAAFDDLGPVEQTQALDRAGLDSCLGGAFHPGIEVPWSVRVPSMWARPGRLRVRSTTVQLADHGDELTPEATMAADGPLAGSGPGDLTRWMSTPWHTDAASCRSGREPEISTVLPTFWPARVPNHVLREADYRVVVDTAASPADRQAAFERRYDWQRFTAASDRRGTLTAMAARWAEMGLVTAQPGPADGAFPAVMLVETHVGFDEEPATTWSAAFREIDPLVWDGGPTSS